MATLIDPAAEHIPLVVTARTTRAQVQGEIEWVRHTQRRLPAEFARRYDDRLSDLLDALLAREPEPA